MNALGVAFEKLNWLGALLKIILNSIAAIAVLIATPALAANTANWTGIYLDADVGSQWNSYSWTYNGLNLPGFPPFSVSSSDGVIAGHVGYQQQFNWLVVGAEFGGLAAFSNPFATSVPTSVPGGPPCRFGTGTQCQVTGGSFVTGGGKLGVAWQDWLAYGVGGAAFDAGIRSQAEFNGAVIETSSTGNANGYYVGGGLDYMITKTNFGELIVGAEYEHIALGAVQLFSSSNGFLACSGVNCGQRTISATEEIVLGKLTLKFNPFGP
jgi:opacity protein-like surface antigen